MAFNGIESQRTFCQSLSKSANKHPKEQSYITKIYSQQRPLHIMLKGCFLIEDK